MGTPGIVYRDLGVEPGDPAGRVPEATPVPRNAPTKPVQQQTPVTKPIEHEETTTTLTDGPTESHALAMEAASSDYQEERGAAQVDHGEEVVNLGWNLPKDEIVAPLVGGLSNEDLWLLVRRFNKQMYHVKEIATAPPGGLDLNIADEEEFSPDKLRANVERLYMTIGIGMIGFVKHIVRIRSWRETRRTSWFCAAYFVAWAFDLLVPLISLTLVTLIVYPPSRDTMFPPAPIALVSASGGVQKPKAGTLGSKDSITGAPENHKGEAVEQEATNFVNGIASVALSSATGKHPQGEPPEGDAQESHVPDPTRIAVSAADAKDVTAGAVPSKHHDKTKVPMETAMWTKMRPVMHALADITDTWERFANLLEPTPPFPKNRYHYRLAAVVAPLFLISLFVTSYMYMKGLTFGIGFGFFGDPIFTRTLEFLDRKYPKWQQLLELRNTLLKGVPTNAQLTITLLRIGEANKAPLVPPPQINEAPPEKPVEISEKDLRAAGADWPLNATKEELDEAMAHDPTTAHETGGPDIDAAKDTKATKKGNKVVNFFRSAVKGGVETSLGADKLKAAVGAEHAKNRLGAVPPKNVDMTSGPIEFKSRFNGKKGHVYITTKATIPCIAFSTDSTIEKIGSVDREDLHPLWSIPVGEISEIRKVGGFGWKAKLVVGWAMGREIADGVVITDRKGVETRLTAMPLRDELFNRLVAMGGQKWECW